MIIALIVIGSIIVYFLAGFGTVKAVLSLDPGVYHDAWDISNSDPSVLGVTMTILFWPITLSILIMIILGSTFYHYPWRWWSNLIKKLVGTP